MGDEVDDEVVGDGGDGSSPEEVAEAKKLGWSPKENWRGDPAAWKDSKEFLRRGKEVLPIVQATNRKLVTDLTNANRQIAALKGTVDEQSQTLKDILEHQASEIKRQVESRISDLRSQKREAIKEGDHDRAADLDEKIDKVRDELAKAEEKPKPKPAVKTFEGKPIPADVEPWAEEFGLENDSWLGKDKRKTSLFMGICEEIYGSTTLRGRELLEEGKKQMEETLSPKPRAASKSESGSGGWGKGSGGGGGQSDGKSYDDLPKEAKDACRDQAKKFVGKLPNIKTEADWQKYYAKTFFDSQTQQW